MRFHIKKNDQSLGPFEPEYLQEQIYRGELTHETPACVEGGSDWVPLDTLLRAVRPGLAPAGRALPPKLDLARLRDATERTALTWLYVASVPVWLLLLVYCIVGLGIPLLVIGLVWLLIVLGELWYAAHLKTNAVRVSAEQLPDLHRVVAQSCERLGMACPDVYVLQHNVWNAFATKIFKRRMVVLFSGAVDSILLKGDMEQMAWLLGHELGHHWAGHLDFPQKLARAGGWLIWVNLWHSRRRELTCDRVGLYCAGSLKASQLALMNATVGAQLADKVNLAVAQQQWQEYRGEFFVKYRTIYATHPHLLARLDHLTSAAGELGIG